MEDIDCSIGISVKGCPAFRTDPVPYLKVFRTGPLCSAHRASLAGRIEAAYGDELLPVPCSLVGELPAEPPQPASEMDLASL